MITLTNHFWTRFTGYKTVALFMGDSRASALLELSIEDFLLLRERLRYKEANPQAKRHRRFRKDLRGNNYSIRVLLNPTTKRRMVSLVMAFHCGNYQVWIEEEKLVEALQQPDIPWTLFPFWNFSIKLAKIEMRCLCIFLFLGNEECQKKPKIL